MARTVIGPVIGLAVVLVSGCLLILQQMSASPLPTQIRPNALKQPTSSAQSRVLSITLDGARDRENELLAVARYLKDVGIDARVRTEEYEALVAAAQAGKLEAYATDWGSATFTPVDLAVPKLRTSDRGNFSHYTNPEVDSLLDIGASVVDNTAANNAFFRVQDVLYRDAPWIFGYYRDTIEAGSARVQNWRPSSDGRINLHKVAMSGSNSIVVGLRADRLLSLDPADYRDRETETVIRNMFDGLVTRSADGIVLPEIAQSWTVPDSRTYVFQLRRGVKFHNGDPLTADDVVFTFNRILDPTGTDGRESPRRGLLGPLKNVEKVGDYSVRMNLSIEYSAFLQLLVHTQIVPKKYYDRVGFSGFGNAPVGAGPFKFVSSRSDRTEVVMERFTDYWDGPPTIEKAIFRTIPDPSARLTALKNGDVSIINEVPPDAVDRLKADPEIQVQMAQGTRMYEIELDNNKFADPRVRQALNYAVDLNSILTDLYGDHAHRVSTAFLPNGFGYNPGLAPFIYNPGKATTLLQQAGYSVK